jgi:hypothetical protein
MRQLRAAGGDVEPCGGLQRGGGVDRGDDVGRLRAARGEGEREKERCDR